MSNTSKHTPGPWRIESWASILHICANGHTGAIADIHQDLGVPYNDKEALAVRDANARLIAAAPDLLEALQTATRLLRLLNAPGTNDPIEAAVYKANAAITKATQPQ